LLEPIFDDNSFGYRPGRSALDAVDVVRRRSWRYDWVVEFDVQALFDTIDHELLLRAVRKHCRTPWVLLYIERWLTAPMVLQDGTQVARTRGTPQGGVVSPLLANLFLHYALDIWMRRNLRSVRLCRYADDGVVHCKSEEQAKFVLRKIGERLRECGLELHPEKTRIAYCQDINRQAAYPTVQFTFLGYTFRPRRTVDKYGRLYVNFSPGVSRDALRAMRQQIRGWHLQLKCDKSLSDLSGMFNPILRGWANYYGRFAGAFTRRMGTRLRTLSSKAALQPRRQHEPRLRRSAHRRHSCPSGAARRPRQGRSRGVFGAVGEADP
jgi:RNA-directed DNA polymerase